MPESLEGLGAQADVEGTVVAQPGNDLRVGGRQVLDTLPCAVGRTVVDDDDLIAPPASIDERSRDDIRFVLHHHQAVYLKSCRVHRSVYASSSKGGEYI